MAGVGTVNLGNRYFFLNFEIMAFAIDSQFVRSVETVLQKDLCSSGIFDLDAYRQKLLWFKLAARVSRLLAPIL